MNKDALVAALKSFSDSLSALESHTETKNAALFDMLRRIEGKLDVAITRSEGVRREQDRLDAALFDHEARIATIEGHRANGNGHAK